MLNKLFDILTFFLKFGFLRPGMRIPAMLLLGVFVGMGLLLAQVSRATSYLSNDAKTCINCHVMTDAYISWEHSSHARHAVCNDCHVPHTSIPRAYAFKAHDGLRHASIFTLRLEPQSIKLSEGAIPVVQENCLRCHEERLAEVSACRYQTGDFRCWDCHRDIPHGQVHSLSASPDTFRPELPPVGLGK
ncbi:MAG: cytochrome c nitrite reductase small subunit [Planctomycetaceae bacterium]|nr:cytochrome c nitrite reductase small subunit [Planctomycetaceae bacterium]